MTSSAADRGLVTPRTHASARSVAVQFSRQSCAFTLLVAAALRLAGAAGAAPNSLSTAGPVPIHIAGGDIVTALQQLASETHIEFVYNAERLGHVRVNSVDGILTPKAALERLLQGTGLTLTEYAGALLIGERGDMTPSTGSSTRGSRSTDGPDSARDSVTTPSAKLAPLIVTGTHIVGTRPAGSTIIVYTRVDIENAGGATLEDFARDLPENFSGADALATAPNTNANFGLLQQGATYNVFGGSGFNLRGLGAASTLTMIDGHRIAPGALDGSLVDLSLIPLSAIERVEVLDDGASAIYGSDAIAGVVNLVTRRHVHGAETQIRCGQSADGGADQLVASQLVGWGWGAGSATADYEFEDQGGLRAVQREWIDAQGGPVSLIPANHRNSLFIDGDQRLEDDARLTMEMLYSRRTFSSASVLDLANALANEESTGQATATLAAVGLNRPMFGDWQANLTGDYSKIAQTADSSSQSLDNNDGIVRAHERLVSDSDIASVEFSTSGTLLRLGGGALRASLGGAYRTEHFRGGEYIASAGVPIALGRQVASAYGELNVPIVGAENQMRWARRLAISAAARYDHYAGFGPTTNPKVGVTWQPARSFRLRSSFAKSFQAPLLTQLALPVTTNTQIIPDSAGPMGQLDVLEINGGNGGLQPERSTTFTASVDNAPDGKSPSISLTYYYGSLKNQIETQNITSPALLAQPRLFPFLSLNPPLAQVQTYFSSAGFLGDYAGLGPAGVGAIFDNRFANIAATVESRLELTAKYPLATSLGAFDFWISGARLLREQIQTAIFEPRFDIANTIGEPPKWKAHGGVRWTQSGFAAGLTLHYVNAYQNTLFTPAHTIGAWATADIFLRYDTGGALGLALGDLGVRLDVRNLADRRPPSLEIPAVDLLPGQPFIPFDGSNASPVGRFVELQITKKW